MKNVTNYNISKINDSANFLCAKISTSKLLTIHITIVSKTQLAFLKLDRVFFNSHFLKVFQFLKKVKTLGFFFCRFGFPIEEPNGGARRNCETKNATAAVRRATPVHPRVPQVAELRNVTEPRRKVTPPRLRPPLPEVAEAGEQD